MSTIDLLLKFQALHMCYSGQGIDRKKKKKKTGPRESVRAKPCYVAAPSGDPTLPSQGTAETLRVSKGLEE